MIKEKEIIQFSSQENRLLFVNIFQKHLEQEDEKLENEQKSSEEFINEDRQFFKDMVKKACFGCATKTSIGHGHCFIEDQARNGHPETANNCSRLLDRLGNDLNENS